MLERRPQVIAGGLGALAVVAVVLLVLGLSASDDPRPAPRGIPVARVLEDPLRYDGREITVTGEVSLLTDRALSMGEGDLIVVSRAPGAPSLETSGYGVSDPIYATGQLRIMSADEVTDRLPRTSLLPSQFQGFDRQPVLLADEVIPAS